MTEEQRILDAVEALRAEVAPLVGTARSMESLKKDLTPRVEEAVRALIIELADVEGDFQMEDLLFLLKKSMRNVRNFSKALDQLRSVIAFAENLEPLIHDSVPAWIARLDELEQRGVFAVANSLVGVMEKVSAAYGPEDMERIGDGLVHMMGLARSFADPKAQALVARLAEAPARVDLGAVKPAGPMALLGAMRDPGMRKGLGLMLELTRALGADAPAPASEAKTP